MIAPHTGAPAITVPMGFTGQGLPTGLQFLGRPFDEPGIIRLAYAYEQGSRARRPPPLFPECSSPEPGTPPHGDSSFAG
jgi:Asp-tRNA(Asn)/Glu-tRNA(Gln) amidotransferase A subunit family amidase